jgi:betaine-aldehyde dehydrogenase
MVAAAQDIKNVSLELGGKSPFVVFDDSDISKAAEWVMFGVFWNQGQVCSATSRLIVQEGIADELLERLSVEAGRISSATVSARACCSALWSAVRSTARFSVSSMPASEMAPSWFVVGNGRTAWIAATSWNRRSSSMYRTIRCSGARRSFGPVLSVRTFRDEAEAIRLSNDSSFGLAAAVMSDDLVRCRRVAAALKAGIVWINCSQPTFTQAPWGGVKRSGIGRELGRWGLENYLEVKQVTSYDSANPWSWYIKG